MNGGAYDGFNEGAEKVLNDIRGRKINFDVGCVPGVKGNIDSSKAQILGARGVYVAQSGEKIVVTSNDAKKIAESVRKKMRKLHLGIGDFEIISDIDTGEFDHDIESYGRYIHADMSPEYINHNMQVLKLIEKLNSKDGAIRWLIANGFEGLVPGVLFEGNVDELINYGRNNFLNNRWVKSSIGASGIGTWRGDRYNENQLREFDTKNKRKKHFDSEGKFIGQERDGKIVGVEQDMSYIVQESATGNSEYSISYFIDNEGVHKVTETINIVSCTGAHIGNRSLSIRPEISCQIDNVAKKLKKAGYVGVIGIDFIANSEGSEVKILEMNPRHTGATTPAVFAHIVSKSIGEKLSWSAGTQAEPYSDPKFTFREHGITLYNTN